VAGPQGREQDRAGQTAEQGRQKSRAVQAVGRQQGREQSRAGQAAEQQTETWEESTMTVKE